MKIQCPSCQHEGVVSEDKVPAAGVNVVCPKCKTKFKITPPSDLPSTDFYCPKSETKQIASDICVKCGIVFSKYLKAQENLKKNKAEVVEDEPRPNVITNAMICEKSFKSANNILTFNADGMLSGTGSNDTITWSINLNGQLIIENQHKVISISTLVSGNEHDGWLLSTKYNNGTTSTMTLTPFIDNESTNSSLYAGNKATDKVSQKNCVYEEHVRPSPTVTEEAGGGCMLSLAMFTFGCLLLCIPIIGWFAGPLM